MSGRGYGKTRTGAELTNSWATQLSSGRLGVIGATDDDVRDTMVEGESGILACSPPNFVPDYVPSKRLLIWPNGCRGILRGAQQPRTLRGPQFHKAWCDEVAAWTYPDEAWANLMFGLRLGDAPQAVATTTPKPLKLLRELLKDPSCVVTRGTSYENRANLAESYWDANIKPYEGTRRGRQEIGGEYLEDVPGALWTRAMIDATRIDKAPAQLGRIVVAIDPAVTSGEDSNETGIVVVARGVEQWKDHAFVLRDLSGRHAVTEWPRLVVGAVRTHKADRAVAEVNNGGDLVEATLRVVDPTIPYRSVHASRGKRTRAEPVAALYEQGKVHHVGSLPVLEDQMCNFVPDSGSDVLDDRVDASVWGLTDLMLGGRFMIA